MTVIGSQSVAFSSGGIVAGNAILGASIQDELGTVNPSFPCGITGYGYIGSSGNQNGVWGVFGRVDHNTTQGSAVHELDVNMMNTDSANVFPPNLGFPIPGAYGICLQLANIGIKRGHTALRVVNTAQFGTLAPWLCGIYMDPPGVAGMLYGLFIDGSSSFSAATSVLVKNTGQGSNVHGTFQTMGTAVPTNPVLQHLNASGVATFQLDQSGSIVANGCATFPTFTGLPGLYVFGDQGTGFTAATAAAVLETYNNNTAAFGSAVTTRAARGSAASPGNLANGDLIGSFGAQPRWAGAFGFATAGVNFNYTDDGTHAGTEVEFRVTPNGSTVVGSRITAGKILNSGGFAWGSGAADPGVNNIGVVGVYKVGSTQVVGARQTGWTVATGTPSRATFTTGGVTLSTLAGVVMALEQDLITHGLIGP